MACRRWISAVILATNGVMLPGPLARCQAPPAIAAPDVPADAQALIEHNLVDLFNRLVLPVAPGVRDDPALQQQRDDCARRLLSRTPPYALQLALAALKDQFGRHAVVRAIAADPHADPAFIDPLLKLLGGERTLSDDAARALARYGDNPASLPGLLAFAQDGNQQPNLRIGVIRALGEVVKREVVNALFAILTEAGQLPALQNAAADALVKITGETGIGRDIEGWKRWQAARANKVDIVWLAEVLAAREKRAAQEDRGKDDFTNELKRMLEELFEKAAPGAKGEMIMRMLNSTDAHVRAMGVQKYADQLVFGAGLPAAGRKRLEDLVGDSDVDVRIKVALVIDTLNDLDALDALLAQVAQEPNIDAKIAQIAALVHMKRLRVIPELLQLLRDPSMRVAGAAVKAIRELAPILRVQNVGLAHDVAADLWKVGNERAAEPGGEVFRAATIEGVGAFHDRGMVNDLLEFLKLGNPPALRSAALRALAEMGDHAASFGIAQWLKAEPVAAVRIDAIQAYGATSTFEDAAATLYEYMSPNTEPDPGVRNWAWLVFQSLLPKANNLDVLAQWATTFQNDPSRRLAVLLQLNAKYRQELKWDDLAMSQQNTGETYMKPPLSDPTKAAIEFEAALEYWQKRGVNNQVTVQLVHQLFIALFAARDFDKAASIGGKQIARDRRQQGVIVGYFKDEIDRLYTEGARDNDQKKLKDGLRLTEAALKIQPPLEERFMTDLQQYKQNIEAKVKKP